MQENAAVAKEEKKNTGKYIIELNVMLSSRQGKFISLANFNDKVIQSVFNKTLRH